MEGTKLVFTLMLCIASCGFAYAGVRQVWNESNDLINPDWGDNLHPSFEDTSGHFTIGLLGLIDQILIAGVFLLIVAGSLQVYVIDPSTYLLTGKPRRQAPALDGLTSGTLKEKTISTIKIASALYLFRMMLTLGGHQPLTWIILTMLVVYHLLFIIGFDILSRRNEAHDKVKHAAATAPSTPHPTLTPPKPEGNHNHAEVSATP
jgi:uncharacterized membrane protein YqhA